MIIKNSKPALMIFAATLLFGAAVESARGQTAGAPAGEQQPSDGVTRISGDDLRVLLARGEAIVVDVRGADSYLKAHIKGAKNIPLNEIAQRAAAELPRDKMIVTYCS